MLVKLAGTVAAAVLVATSATIPAEAAVRYPYGIQPCQSDDGLIGTDQRCVWDARHMGNGLGSSYISRGEAKPVKRIGHRWSHMLIRRWNETRG